MRLDPPLPPTHLGKLRELPLLLLLRMLRLDQIPEARAIDYCLQEGVSLIACKAERRHSHGSGRQSGGLAAPAAVVTDLDAERPSIRTGRSGA